MLSRIKAALSGIKTKIMGDSLKILFRQYMKKFKKYAFIDLECRSPEQFEASIIRLYHTIEKGLAYEDYRAGFGRDNIDKLITSLKQYSERGYDIDRQFYQTAISCLNAYVEKNKKAGLEDKELEDRISALPGRANELGGALEVSAPDAPEQLSFEELLSSRHSIRHFSDKPVDIDELRKAVELAQYTPSACNRQGWKTRIIADKKVIESVLANQNGNRGFGQEIDKLLVVTADLRAQQRSRELFQAYIDGGMYAENVLNALYSKGIGSVPLSASLTIWQEKNVREILKLHDAEVLIIFIGVGNYPEGSVTTTKSERKAPETVVV